MPQPFPKWYFRQAAAAPDETSRDDKGRKEGSAAVMQLSLCQSAALQVLVKDLCRLRFLRPRMLRILRLNAVAGHGFYAHRCL
jgi:hypothetical protein